jgi:glutamate--cysteine ligase
LVRDGLAAHLGDAPVRALAERVLEISGGGLARRRRLSADGDDERIHLVRLTSLVERGQSPADALLEGLDPAAPDLRQQLIERSRV